MDPLSPKELQVLAMVVEGRTTKEIAASLSLAERTVKAYLSAIYRKLGATNRAQAAAIATERGYLRRKKPGSE